MSELILVRCVICEVSGMQGVMFNNIKETVPVKVVGVMPLPTGIVKSVIHDAYICPEHYERFERVN